MAASSKDKQILVEEGKESSDEFSRCSSSESPAISPVGFEDVEEICKDFQMFNRADVDLPSAAEAIRQKLGSIPVLLQQIQDLRSLWQSSEEDLQDLRAQLHEKTNAIEAATEQDIAVEQLLYHHHQSEACLSFCRLVVEEMDHNSISEVVQKEFPGIFGRGEADIHFRSDPPLPGITGFVEEKGKIESGKRTEEHPAFDEQVDPRGATFAYFPMRDPAEGCVLGSLRVVDREREDGFEDQELVRLELMAAFLERLIVFSRTAQRQRERICSLEDSVAMFSVVEKLFDVELLKKLEACPTEEREAVLKSQLQSICSEEGRLHDLSLKITNSQIDILPDESTAPGELKQWLCRLSAWLNSFAKVSAKQRDLSHDLTGCRAEVLNSRQALTRAACEIEQAMDLVKRLQNCCGVLIAMMAELTTEDYNLANILTRSASGIFASVDAVKVHVAKEAGDSELALLCARTGKTIENGQEGSYRLFCPMPISSGAIEASFTERPTDELDKWFLETLSSGADAALHQLQVLMYKFLCRPSISMVTVFIQCFC